MAAMDMRFIPLLQEWFWALIICQNGTRREESLAGLKKIFGPGSRDDES
jgi:hypothetical protein